MLRTNFTIFIGLFGVALAAFGQQRMVSIGDRRLSIECKGDPSPATVVLMAGGGRTANDWSYVRPAVAKFTHVCSYDRAGFGQSDKVEGQVQSPDEVVDDLHRLLKASGEQGPFVLVAHSVAGFYARDFVTKYPHEVTGLVFVDSSHEEQELRLHEIGLSSAPLNDAMARVGFLTKPGERLQWHTELPLIVLSHGQPQPQRDGTTEEQLAAWDRSWREFQLDLAKRSTHGEFRLAEQSGHFIQFDQPELVIQAIRDVIARATAVGSGATSGKGSPQRVSGRGW